MAFFSSSSAYDGAQLRRKRSLSKERPSFGDRSRPSTADKSSDESSMRKRSPSMPTSSPGAGADTSESRPPLPTPVSAGISRPRGSAQPDKPPSQPSPYDQTSTPIPFTKPVKQASPPPFSNLVIDISRSPSRHSPSTPAKHSAQKSLSSDPPDVDSSSASRVSPYIRHEQPSSAQSYGPTFHEPPLSDFARSKSHSPTRIRPATASASLPTSRPNTSPPRDLDLLAPKPPVGMSSSASSKPSSRKALTALPTPISPPQSRSIAPTESNTKPSEHSHSRSYSHTPPSRSPASEPPNPRRAPMPRLKLENPRSPPPSAPASSSGTSTPTPDAKHEKRHRNVLRKPSVSKRESNSAPTSDNERKSKTHRPRARSGVFAAIRRNSGGAVFELTPSAPTTSITPAGEVLIAYKESQRGTSFNSSREASFGNSGKLVAIGAPDDEMKSPWTPGWRSVRSHDEGQDDEKSKGLRRSLSRKLSERWGSKDPERARPNAQRSTSGPAELLQEKARHSTSAKRSASFRRENKLVHSPRDLNATQSRSPEQTDDGQGRVWEEDVGDWALGRTRTREGSDSSSPGRLWKLVKRFSSGNLREKHSPPLEAPPPVPPLPRDFGFARRTASGDAEKRADLGEMPVPQTAVLETPGGIMRYITSMPSFSIPRAKAVAHGRDPSAHGWADIGSGAMAGPSTSDVSTRASHRTGARRSTNTRSSSPSSDGTKLFSRSRSSSNSSYGETVPPMPNAAIGQHIVPPHELHLLVTEKSEGSSPAVRPLQITARKVVKPTTPLSSSASGMSTASLTIPKFEVHNASNQFAPYKGKQVLRPSTPPTSHFPDPDSLSPVVGQPSSPHPPPVPMRSPRRPSSISIPTLSLAGRQQSLPGVILVQESSESEATDLDVQQRRSSSTRTPKARPRSISDGAVIPEPTKSPGLGRSPLTFREMSSPKQPLTEQEKNAKWEDLLQRSDMAGGTLHVGSRSAGDLALWSDRASLAPSETLDRF